MKRGVHRGLGGGEREGTGMGRQGMRDSARRREAIRAGPGGLRVPRRLPRVPCLRASVDLRLPTCDLRRTPTLPSFCPGLVGAWEKTAGVREQRSMALLPGKPARQCLRTQEEAVGAQSDFGTGQGRKKEFFLKLDTPTLSLP